MKIENGVYILSREELATYCKDAWRTGRVSGLQEASHMVVQMLPSDQLELSTALALELLEATKREPYGFTLV